MIRRNANERLETISLRDIALPLMDEAKLFNITRAYPLKPHCHPIFEMHYVRTGFLSWQLAGGVSLDVRGGDVTVIQPNTRHRSANDAETPSIFLALCIVLAPPSPSPPFVTKEEQAEAFRILREGGSRVVRGSPELDAAFTALRSKAYQLAHADGRGAPNPRRHVDETFPLSLPDTALLRNLLHQCFLRMLSSLANPSPTPHYTPVTRAIRFMKKDIGKQLSLPELAKATGVSRSRLNTLFHAETGQNPAEFLLRLRLDRAMLMLQNHRWSVTNIALRLGFSSSQHFAASFRKYFGLTPSAWRRAHEAHADPRKPASKP